MKWLMSYTGRRLHALPEATPWPRGVRFIRSLCGAEVTAYPPKFAPRPPAEKHCERCERIIAKLASKVSDHPPGEPPCTDA